MFYPCLKESLVNVRSLYLLRDQFLKDEDPLYVSDSYYSLIIFEAKRKRVIMRRWRLTRGGNLISWKVKLNNSSKSDRSEVSSETNARSIVANLCLFVVFTNIMKGCIHSLINNSNNNYTSCWLQYVLIIKVRMNNCCKGCYKCVLITVIFNCILIL